MGSTLHLLSGAVELARELWDGTYLHLTLRCPGEHSGTLAVYVPAHYTYLPAVNDAARQDNRVLRVPLQLVEAAEIVLQFAELEAP